MAQTLAQLKAENAKLEQTESEAPQAIEEEIEDEAVEDEQTETEEIAESPQDEVSEEDTEQEVEAETEEWMQSDEPESQEVEKKFTDSDIAAAKTKLKAKLTDRHNSEVDELKAKIELLEKGQNQQITPVGNKPKRADFFEHDDPDEAYLDALSDWKFKNINSKQQAETAANEAKQANQLRQQQINDSVEQHYERAALIAKKANIDVDAYRSAELKVRQMIDSVRPGAGDAIADALIDSIGEGSEKVFYNLGVNNGRLNALKDKIQNDSSGLKAVAYLASLASDLNAPQRRKTTAPKPAKQIKGDNAASASMNAIKRKYDKLHNEGKTQEAFKFKRQAKKDGTDTSTW